MKVHLNDSWQLLSHICEHIEVLIPRFLRCITIMTGPISNEPISASVWNRLIYVSRACIRHDHGDAAFLALLSVSHPHSWLLVSVLYSCEEVDNRVGLASLFLDLFLWKEDAECHRALIALTPVLDSLDEATLTLDSVNNSNFVRICCLWHVLIDVDNATKTLALVHSVHQIINLVKSVKGMS